MTSTTTPYSEDLKWQALVGKAILRFGDIEMVSLQCLAHIPQDKIGDSAARLEFSRRVGILIELLEARPNLNAPMQGLLDGFRRAKALVTTRNLIAHNPVMLDIYVGRGAEDFLSEHTIRSARSGAQTLKLDELTEFAEEVENLSSTLWGRFLEASGTADSLWRTHVLPAA